MEKANYSQLELFPHSESGNAQARQSNSFLRHVWGYEKAILLVIGFIVTGVISFSLGIEKGKSLIVTEARELSRPVPVVSQPKISAPVLNSESAKQPQPVKIKGYKNGFTIQIASYQAKKHAEKAIEALKKKGFSPLIISKSGYAVVCVGNFPDRQTAKSILTELKKQYQDCFIRRL